MRKATRERLKLFTDEGLEILEYQSSTRNHPRVTVRRKDGVTRIFQVSCSPGRGRGFYNLRASIRRFAKGEPDDGRPS